MNDLIPTTPPAGMIVYDDVMAQAGAAADRAARGNAFESWRIEMAHNTRRRKAAGVDVYAEYICSLAGRAAEKDDPAAAVLVASMQDECARLNAFAEALRDNTMAEALDGEVWSSLTCGLIENFQDWMLDHGYSIGTVNNRTSTLKVFAGLAFKAGFLPAETNMLIQAVSGYGRKKGQRIDENRKARNVPTRVGKKKAKAIEFSVDEALGLIKMLAHDARGKRDRLILTLLMEHGLRVSELADLETDNVNIGEGTFRFFRRKTGDWDQHKFKTNSGKALRDYFNAGLALEGEKLLRSSVGTRLGSAGYSTSAIGSRVKSLGKLIGLEKLSPHDFRHFYATDMAKNKTDINAGKRGGGWASVAMYDKYINQSEMGNEGVKLSTDASD